MRIKSETELLDIGVRKAIIEEIRGSENQARKYEAYKRYMIYKDQTDAFVKEQLLKQFDYNTVQEMEYGIANISVCRKIIDKLARVYNSGVRREIEGDEESSKVLQELAKEIDLQTQLRKTNRFLKLQKNVALYIKPCPIEDKWKLSVQPLNPYLYDAVEYEYDRTIPMAFILSDFEFFMPTYTTSDAATVDRSSKPMPVSELPQGNGKDEAIADSPDDAKSGEYVWWTNSFHFTTDQAGEIISDRSNITNPIQMLPIINYAIDQDGQFWARGGDDLIKGSVLINSLMTHYHHVGVTQGYGQFWMRGKNLPRNIKIGPTKAILMEYEEGEPQPDLGYASSSPQLADLQSLGQSYTALLLTTNNLSTSAVAAQLGQNNNAASGIAMMIDKAESREDTVDQQQVFVDNEPVIFEIIRRWLDVFGDSLVDNLKKYAIPENFNLIIKFLESPVIVSESEKLANLKLRKELGIDTMVDLIMRDNPESTKEQAEEKLKEILAERMSEPVSRQKPEQEMQDEEQAEDGNEADEGNKV